MHTLPTTNPLRNATKSIRKFKRFCRSPFYELATALNDIPVDELETINPFSLAPWAERIRTITDDDDAATGIEAGADGVMHVAVSSSARNGLVGSGAVLELSPTSGQGAGLGRHSFTLGLRTKQNPFSGELAAITQRSGVCRR